ncbi:hypothetical protein BKA63DRAFT_263948 [Paraphoma chrysanthemicola]|nr:hypothetical protein BKA63DRAFT_263948 [Paraphoma chrysanthemicola]
MSQPEPTRLETELELLAAMYPEQASYVAKAREFKFTQDGAVLQLRLPDTYPEKGLPDVIAASDASKADLRAKTKAFVNDLSLTEGEEALDAVVAAFQQVLNDSYQEPSHNKSNTSSHADTSKTVIIWLHHLLAITKRKLAISPTGISGITKPGYPGIMVFSGPAAAVTDHVNTLKGENWQAFQVRYEEEQLWTFAHGEGVKEVETMAEAVKHVEGSQKDGIHETQKEEFLKAIGIK